MNNNSGETVISPLEIESKEVNLKKGLLLEDTLNSKPMIKPIEGPRASVASTNATELASEEFTEPEYHDTYRDCIKRLIGNCFVGIFIDSLRSGVLGSDNN